MRKQIFCMTVLAALLVAMCVSVSQAVDIDYVTIGNLGSADDTHGAGYGGVDYVYAIGKYEVTNSQYAEFLNAVATTDNTYGLYNAYMSGREPGGPHAPGGIDRGGSGIQADPWHYSPQTDRADWPVNYVSWGDAARFANWLHNDQGNGDTEDGAYNLSETHPYYNSDGSINDVPALRTALMAVSREDDWKCAIPSEDEWYKAAYHKNDGVTGNYWDYPTQNDTSPIAEPPPGGNNSANYDWVMPDPFITNVDDYPSSTSAYGTFDQGGNVSEWNEDLYDDGLSRVLRGGSFSTPEANLGASWRDYTSALGEGSGIGFRVASVPEPHAGMLLTVGALTLTVCSWRRSRR